MKRRGFLAGAAVIPAVPVAAVSMVQMHEADVAPVPAAPAYTMNAVDLEGTSEYLFKGPPPPEGQFSVWFHSEGDAALQGTAPIIYLKNGAGPAKNSR